MYNKPLFESVNSSIISNILKDPYTLLNSMHKRSTYISLFTDDYTTLTKMYKNLSGKTSSYTDIKCAYESIDIEKAKERFNYTDDDIVLIINNINKLVLKMRDSLLHIIDKNDANFRTIVGDMIYDFDDSYTRLLLSVTNDDFIKLTVTDIKKNDSKLYKSLILTSPLVIYYSAYDTLLGITNFDKNLVKYNTYYGNDKDVKLGTPIYNINKEKLDNILQTGIKLDTLYTYQGVKLYAIPLKIINTFEALFNVDHLDRVNTKHIWSRNSNEKVLRSIYSKDNKLYNVLEWGTNNDDYCYICTRSINGISNNISLRSQHKENTDTDKRYKWKKDVIGNIIPYQTKIKKEIDQIKYLIYNNDDKFNENILNQNISTRNLNMIKQYDTIYNDLLKDTENVQETVIKISSIYTSNQNDPSFNFALYIKLCNISKQLSELTNKLTKLHEYIKRAQLLFNRSSEDTVSIYINIKSYMKAATTDLNNIKNELTKL